MDSHFTPSVRRLATLANDLLRDVEQIFAHDLQDPRLNPPGLEGHEQFIARVNAIGHALMNQGDYCLAGELYRNCIHDAQEFRKKTGVRRHLGTLYANLAINCLCHGNIDEGIYYFQHATNEDRQTAGIDPSESHANVLLEGFTTHVCDMIAGVLSTHRLGIVQTDLEALFAQLPRSYYFALLAYSHSFVYNYQYLQNLGGTPPWFYTYNQMMSALRNMTAVFEDMQRSYLPPAHPPQDGRSLDMILTARHSPRSGVGAPWWGMYSSHVGPLNGNRANIGFAATIQAIDTIPRANHYDEIAGAVLITYFARNHLGHRLAHVNEIGPPLAMNLVGSILYALIHVQ
jgi:hypothetical protein